MKGKLRKVEGRKASAELKVTTGTFVPDTHARLHLTSPPLFKRKRVCPKGRVLGAEVGRKERQGVELWRGGASKGMQVYDCEDAAPLQSEDVSQCLLVYGRVLDWQVLARSIQKSPIQSPLCHTLL